tara:strand:+ start:191 stop:406 length:216 start_codon:yes stop_codon:yes gene_type:complete
MERHMFLAIVMVCSLVREGDCMKFTDTLGPHLNREKCMTRMEEMVTSFNPTLPEEAKQFYFKCANDTGTKV